MYTSHAMICFITMVMVSAAPLDGTTPIQDPFAAVEDRVERFMKEERVPSIAIAVAKDGEVVWEKGFGWANREEKIQATPRTVYALASISKSMTATAVMILNERGMLDLDKPANDYLGPAKMKAYEGDASDATVKRLVLHTAGLPMHWHFLFPDQVEEMPSMDLSIQKYGIIVTPPGEAYEYSNFGYGILDHIISRVSKKPYAAFMKDEIFEPLGMSHTSVGVDPDSKASVACMYNELGQSIPVYDFDHRGASAVRSTAHDVIRYGMFQLKNRLPDQKRILTDETVDWMQRAVDPKVPDSFYHPGFAAVEYSGYRFLLATGSMPGASSRLALIPSENIASVILCNQDSGSLWEIEKVIMDALIPGFEHSEAADEEVRKLQSPEKAPLPDSYLGEWEGFLKVDQKMFPVKMTFSESGRVSMELNGKRISVMNIETPLGEMGFVGGACCNLFRGMINNPDAAQSLHLMWVKLKQRGDRLSGFAAAVAVDRTFCLPHWIELKRVTLFTPDK